MEKPNTKKCSGCKEIKSFNEFNKQKDKKYGLCCACKTCQKKRRESPEDRLKINERNKKWRLENLEYSIKKCRKYYNNNKEKCLKNKKEYYKNNREEKLIKQKQLYLKNKQNRAEYNKKYYKENKALLQQKSNVRKRNKRKNDIKYKLYSNISNMVYVSLRGNKNFKKWTSILNYSVDELKLHLESKFTQGMTWENYGKDGWHIDHIIPQSLFKYESYSCLAFKTCWALENLQPLWATTKIAMKYEEDKSYIGNFEKNNKLIITEEIQTFLNFVNKKDNNVET